MCEKTVMQLERFEAFSPEGQVMSLRFKPEVLTPRCHKPEVLTYRWFRS